MLSVLISEGDVQVDFKKLKSKTCPTHRCLHMQRKIYTTEFGGKTLTAEFNDLTTHANGSVMIKYGETVVLVTAVMGKSNNAGLQYFPLSVEIEVQVVVTVLDIGEDDHDILGVVGASLALGVSDIPWNGPVGVVRLARNKATGEIIQNPTYLDRVVGDLDIEVLACGKDGNINMIETAAYECNETDVTALLTSATGIHGELEKFQKTIIAEIGKPKRVITAPETPAALTEFFEQNFAEKLRTTLFSNQAGKDHIYELKSEFLTAISSLEEPLDGKAASALFEEMIDHELHRGAVEANLRADGREMDDVRELYAQAGGESPVLHGSGIFYRGGTRIFSALTLGGPEAAQMIDTMEERDGKKQFMHHYNFPPFSVGATGRGGGFNRRMIGHGALA